MAPGYEWVFLLSYFSMAVSGLYVLHVAYLVIVERRGRKGDPRSGPRRPRPPRQVF